MIVVVEGPSAAGKTTWAAAHGGRSLVPEGIPAAKPPVDPTAAAAFWAAHHAERWAYALELERRTGVAVCDTDPLKLHYAWSVWRIGAEDGTNFARQAAAFREELARRGIGFADRYLVWIPDDGTLARYRALDRSRRRRNFDLHRRLAEPLREWYGALEAVRPGSVVWEFNAEAIGDRPESKDRYSVDDFDAIVARLPAQP